MTQEGKLILFWLINGLLHCLLVYFSPHDELRGPFMCVGFLATSYYFIYPFFFKEAHLLGFGLNIAPDDKLGRRFCFVFGASLWVLIVYHTYKVP